MSASYPGAVKSFTSRNAGDVIQPAHVNDLQDEVNAIEAGLLNGTAPLNSSNSTVANLSVSGNSTIAGALTVATLNVTGSRVLLTNSARHQIPNSAFTGLSWDTEVSDPSSLHSTSANSSRITFATSSGLWMVGATVEWDNSTAGVRIVRLTHNGSTTIAEQGTDRVNSAGNFGQTITTMVNVNSTADFVTVDVFQNNGSTASLSSGLPVSFWAYKL